ncbi:class I SAM-dependent methyltransferase [Zooshikella harenae]|uniref:Class I SAM-dependent methyltransferase n=1 Tax=Zooshikella harenae TaxID=2827238 RepID=A0ABS5ZJF5_9GAMM|nr:class I SAM-dependent methyltransferase [Zooshikella harenae]MBU2713355.1 class I SAM-dependent methyltransferase [Zooshikella harenae]
MAFDINKITANRLYNDLSHLYPYVIIREDYEQEAPFWIALFNDFFNIKDKTLLELASGPGYLLSYISNNFKASVVDISQEMLNQCTKLNPSVTTYHGDMKSIQLNENFDVVLIHDSIGHAFSETDIKAVCKTAYDHLNKKGIFIISPEFDSVHFSEPVIYHVTRKGKHGEVTIIDYINKHTDHPNELEIFTTYIITNMGNRVVEHDRMKLGLFGLSTYQQIMEETGFKVIIRNKPSGHSGECNKVLVGIKK